jgi:hypothetical protein
MRLEQHNRLVSAMLNCAVFMLFETRANSQNQLLRYHIGASQFATAQTRDCEIAQMRNDAADHRIPHPP